MGTSAGGEQPVVPWAREQFRQCVAPGLSDDAVPLAKACLLIALEEEAARTGDAVHPELRELVNNMTYLRPRSAASASTWSLQRLDALAAEVAALLDSQLADHTQAPALHGAADDDDTTSTSAFSSSVSSSSSSSSSRTRSSSSGVGMMPADGTGADDGLDSERFDLAAEQRALLDRIRSSQQGAASSLSRAGDADSAGPIGGGAPSASASGRPPAILDAQRRLYRRYPMQLLSSVNIVLFDRHGYQACNRHGVPSDHQLASVMEGGVGASTALSILYLEVCERLGFPLAARPLEDGRYFVLWPLETPLRAGGERFLVDPYGRGGLLLLQEVCEIFGVEEQDLRQASRRELLAALLGELRDAHWAAALGCSPSPGLITPITVETALANKVRVTRGGAAAASMARALAAAEKRLLLLPNDSEAQLQYGLLQYFSKNYDDAWIELALYLERYAQPPAAEPPVAAPSAVQPHSTVTSSTTAGVSSMPNRHSADGAAGLCEASSAAPEAPPVVHKGGITPDQTGGAQHRQGRQADSREGLTPDAMTGCSHDAELHQEGTGAELSGSRSVGVQPAAGVQGLADTGTPSSSGCGSSEGSGPFGGGGAAPIARDAAAVHAAQADRVRLLLEKIRLELDFLPSMA